MSTKLGAIQADDISYSLHDLEDAISLGMITRKSWDEHNKGEEVLFRDCVLDADQLADQLFSDESYERKKAIGGLVHKFILNIAVKESSMSSATSALIKWNARMDENHKALLDHIF